jgi:hypothetical protein
MTTMQHQPPPHDFETNIVRISTWRNVQKARKPNVNIALRNKSYWDLRGRWQQEYDGRLDALPEDGIANTVSHVDVNLVEFHVYKKYSSSNSRVCITLTHCHFSFHCNIYSSINLCRHFFICSCVKHKQVAGEIFRAATKIFYDFHNNAMVNNTSGALNYLVENGVLYRASSSSSKASTLRDRDASAAGAGRRDVIVPYDDEIYDILHPYTIGARILLDGSDYNDVARTVESLMDRTIEYIRATPKLDVLSNTVDYNNLREADVVTCIERCAIRNQRAQEMSTQEMVMMMMNMTTTTTTHPTTMTTMDKVLVAQDHNTTNTILPAAAVVTPPSSTIKKYTNLTAPLVTNVMTKKIKSRKGKYKKNRSSTTPVSVGVGGGGGGVENKGMGNNNNTNVSVKVVG